MSAERCEYRTQWTKVASGIATESRCQETLYKGPDRNYSTCFEATGSLAQIIDVTVWVCAQLLQSCLTLCDPMDCNPPGYSVHGILQARILEWVARGSSMGTNPCLLNLLHCRQILYCWATGESALEITDPWLIMVHNCSLSLRIREFPGKDCSPRLSLSHHSLRSKVLTSSFLCLWWTDTQKTNAFFNTS